MSDSFLTHSEAHVATITLNRPEVQNTISSDMLETRCNHLLTANANPDIRVIILTGSGRFFCAGLDMRGG